MSSSAHAAGGRTFEEVLVFFLAASAVILVIWAAYYFTLHSHFIRNDGQYKRILLPILGVVALGFGVTSIITGEVSFGRGSSVLVALEPGLYWRYVALQLGAGCLLIVLGLIYPANR